MLETGAIVGERWRLEELLGEGALSQVWRVRHVELGSTAALKVLVLKRPRLAERLLLEGRIQAQLRHPHIVVVSDVVRHEGYVALVMDLVEGEPLDRHLAHRGALPLEEGLAVMAAVGSAVAAAHDAGVLHRDLKPANILLAATRDGFVPKVADFGIAKVVETSDEPGGTRVGAIMGTPGYLAPEQAVDASSADARCDVFALGVIAFEVLTGQRAFDTHAIDVSTLPAPPRADVVVPSLPPGVADAIARAMALEPDDRFPTVRAFADALLADHPGLLARLATGTPAFPLTLAGEGTHARSTSTTATVTPVTPVTLLPAAASAGASVAAYVALAALAAAVVAYALWPAPTPELPRPAEPAAVAQPPAPPVEIVEIVEPVQQPDPAVAQAPPEPASAPALPPDREPGPARAAVAVPRPAPEPAREAPAAVAPPPETEPEPEEPEVAVVEVRAEEADDLVAAEPPPPPPPPPAWPEIAGTWRGEANGLPLRLRVSSQRGGALEAEAVFVQGPTERQYNLRGSLTPDGELLLSEPGGGLDLRGRVQGQETVGTYVIAGGNKRLPFTLRWVSP